MLCACISLLDKGRHTKELKTEPILDKVSNIEAVGVYDVDRTQRGRFPMLLKRCKPQGSRNSGRTLNRLLDD